MKLLSVKISGFRRFEERFNVRLTEKLIALVGPNEAGKSSFLAALVSLNEDEKISDNSRTRRVRPEATVEATFAIESSERENELSEVEGSKTLERIRVISSSSAQRKYLLEPELSSDISNRARLSELISERNLHHFKTKGNQSEKDRKATLVAEVLRILSLDDLFLEHWEIQTVASLSDELSSFAASDPVGTSDLKDLSVELSRQVEIELHLPPRSARDILATLVPEFLFFDDASRDLKTRYDLSSEPPIALRNLAGLAAIKLDALYSAVKENDDTWITDIEIAANEVLHERLSKFWIRSDVYPRVRIEANELQVMVTAPDKGPISYIDERSDGLRWFLALVGLLHSNKSPVKPILLVDEADRHLSYDAQASLIDVLEKQNVVEKVIYTTHSAGCLPSDLGTGVRPVVPLKGERSIVKNSFSHGTHGLSPLMMAMGLGPLAFTVARNELICEGMSECYLLPSLLREATGVEELGFQVAPGAANVSKKTVEGLDSECGRSLFLLDGDGGGRSISSTLIDAGVRSDQVRMLDSFGGENEDVVLEDLPSIDAFCSAVNQSIQQWQDSTKTISLEDLEDTSRWRSVENWCDREGLKVPGKRDVCQILASMVAEGERIVSPERKQLLKEVYTWAVERFRLSLST